jgi:cytochrome b6
MRELLIWLIVINILAILAVFFPWELGAKADPFSSAPVGIKPEWYFLFMFQVFKFLPGEILFLPGELVGVLLFGIGVLLWAIVPVWDKKTSKGNKNRLLTYFGIFVIIFIIVFTILGFILD